MPLLELECYEVLVALENCGFECLQVISKEEKKIVHKDPYKHGPAQKIWYLNGSDPKINKPYLRCLLDATRREVPVPVPHLATNDVYLRILDPTWMPKPMKKMARRFLALEDEMELDAEPPSKRRRAAPGPMLALPPPLVVVAKRVAAAALPWEEPNDSNDDSNDDENDDNSGRPSLSSSPQDSSNDDAGSSSSSSSSSSKSSGSAGKAERRRAPIVFGLNSLTRRYLADTDEIVSVQANCLNPKHFEGKACSKEMAVAVAGSLDDCYRILKTWLIFGVGMDERKHHMNNEWKGSLLNMLRDGLMLSNAALDAIADSTDLHGNDADVPAPVVLVADDGVGIPVASPLGKCAKGVPPDVHERMEEACLAGGIPVTTLKQRLRNRCKRFRVISGLLAEAAMHGYISPNLPPPAGLKWVCRAGEWTVVPRGVARQGRGGRSHQTLFFSLFASPLVRCHRAFKHSAKSSSHSKRNTNTFCRIPLGPSVTTVL